MRIFRIFGRNFRDSLKSVFRNFSLSLASISCITITLIVVALAMILSDNVNNFASLVEKDVTIVAFISNDATADDHKTLDEQINSLDYIATVSFQDRTEIMEDMKESSDVFNNIMSGWDRNSTPIQDTYLIKVTDIEQIAEVAKKIQEMDHVTVVKYGEGMIEQLISLFDTVRKVSFGAVVALIIVTAFLISNTIKITIFSRRREIEIMRLIGASNINIKIPFILEGLFLGIIGAVVPVIVATYGYVSFYKHFGGQVFSPFIRLITPEPFIYEVSGILILIGMAVGMFGSWRAVKKHLKI